MLTCCDHTIHTKKCFAFYRLLLEPLAIGGRPRPPSLLHPPSLPPLSRQLGYRRPLGLPSPRFLLTFQIRQQIKTLSQLASNPHLPSLYRLLTNKPRSKLLRIVKRLTSVYTLGYQDINPRHLCKLWTDLNMYTNSHCPYHLVSRHPL